MTISLPAPLTTAPSRRSAVPKNERVRKSAAPEAVPAPDATANATVPQPAADDPKWAHCKGCGATTYLPRLHRNLNVCSDCGHHHRLRPVQRLHQLLDADSFVPGPEVVGDRDVLSFVDRRSYQDRLADATRKVGAEAAVYGVGSILGQPVVIAVMDFAFLGGSMGAAVGETITVAAETALATRVPLVVVTASGGARMQEGCISLMQMAKTSQAFARLREAGVLSVCILTDPTYGGVTASFATLAEILIAEPGAMIGFAGPRVVEQATRGRLPDGFQRAEYLLSHGLIDLVEHRDTLRPQLARLIRLYQNSEAQFIEDSPKPVIIRDPAELPVRSAWETLGLARDLQRPSTLDYVLRICEDFVELHGDRAYGDDPAVVGGLASIGGRSVMLVGHQKGHNTSELVARNFGMPHPEGYRKALRLMKLADRAGLPIVTLIDTQGAFPGHAAEERGQAWAIAESIASMSELRTPIVSIIIGEGGSGGALAIAVANEVLIMENACYSVISPESGSTILFGDHGHTQEMAEALRMTAPELLRLGIVDGVVPEPAGGAQRDHESAADSLRGAILQSLDELSSHDPDLLRQQRFERFRKIGRLTPAGDDHV